MVKLRESLALSPEFEAMKEELRAAQEKYTELVEFYTELTSVVGANLEAEYMLKLGGKEHELFSCQVELLRLKREIGLYQAAQNRGEKISGEKVKQILEKEFAEYKKQLALQKEKLNFANALLESEKLSPEECKKLKKSYHNIVRKLHPDLNPDLPAGAAALWERVQWAYQMNDWKELELLADVVDEFLNGKKDFVESIGTLERVRRELDRITQKTADLERQIAETRERVPYSYEKLLDDPEAVLKKRRELDDEIKHCKERMEELKELRKEIGEDHGR